MKLKAAVRQGVAALRGRASAACEGPLEGTVMRKEEEIYKCTSCVERHGSFEPQPGIKPEHSCGHLTHNADVTGLAPEQETK